MLSPEAFPKSEVVRKIPRAPTMRKSMNSRPVDQLNLFSPALMLKIKESPELEAIGLFAPDLLETRPLI